MTILLSSHQLHQVQKICDRVGIMIKGRLVAHGPIDQLARDKFGIDREEYTLEEIYMKYFLEGPA
jgi:ABC-2 type transport system ATP-binding protein